ncbi:unnamed protein product [Urochloa decumbens]|uniref:WRKY domain-containing protein n=1 Tax=Urochloa decumbens TaxID=240449 RepID=A0ABC8VDE1_9POAL
MEEERWFNNNWDLGAVVHMGCRRRLSPPRQPDNPFAAFLPPPPPQKETPPVVPAPAPAPEPAKELPEPDAAWRFPDLFAGAGQDGDELLRALLAPHLPLPQPPLLPTPTPPPQQQQPPVVAAVDVPPPPPQVRAAPARAQPSGRPVPGGVPRSKRRKNQVKKVVCHVPADGSSSDVWAWRKYGQKPIKGSPYPRSAQLQTPFSVSFFSGAGAERSDRRSVFSWKQGILPVQQLQGVRGAEAGGAEPHGPQHLHPHLHRRAQPRRAHPPQLSRRHHPPQVPLLCGGAAAAVRGGRQRWRRRRAAPAPAPAAEPDDAVHVVGHRGALAHDAAADAVRRRRGGGADGGGHGDGRRGRAAVPQRRRRRRGASGAAHVLDLRHRRRALPELLALGVGRRRRRRASHRDSRRRELTFLKRH